MPKTAKKSDKLPKKLYQLIVLNDLLLNTDKYKKTIEKGLRFYTTDQLQDIEKKYEDGITWKEIDAELASQGMIFKKATFRKYVQEKKIPSSIDYKKSRKGREAVYPKDTIKYINLFQYLHRVADNKSIDSLLTLLHSEKVTAKEAIEGELDSQNLQDGVLMYLRGISYEGNDLEKSMADIIGDEPEIYDKATLLLQKMRDTFEKQYEEFEKLLNSHKIFISTTTDDEE